MRDALQNLSVILWGTLAAKSQDDAYAFILGQQGLMAGVSIEGSKISRIER